MPFCVQFLISYRAKSGPNDVFDCNCLKRQADDRVTGYSWSIKALLLVQLRMATGVSIISHLSNPKVTLFKYLIQKLFSCNNGVHSHVYSSTGGTRLKYEFRTKLFNIAVTPHMNTVQFERFLNNDTNEPVLFIESKAFSVNSLVQIFYFQTNNSLELSFNSFQ